MAVPQEIVFRARDLATGKITQVSGSIGKLRSEIDRAGAGMAGANGKAGAFEQSLTKLTSGSQILAGAMQRLRSIFEGFAFTAIIAGISLLVAQIVKLVGGIQKLNAEQEKSLSSMESMVKKLDPVLAQSEEYRRAQFNLTVAQLELARATSRTTIAILEQNLASLKSVSIKQKAIFFLRAFFTTMETFRETSERLSQVADENALKANELRAQIELLRKSLEINIPTWDEYNKRLEDAKTRADEARDALKAQQELLDSIGKTGRRLEIETVLSDVEEEGKAIETQTRILNSLESEQIKWEIRRALRESEDSEKRIAIRRREQEILGQMILENAQLQLRIEQQYNALRIQAASDTANALANISNAIFIFTQGRSRALFEISKIAAIAEATINTYRAANQVLADPSLPAFAKAAAAAAIIASGLANVARIQSTSFASASGIGGAGGGGIPIGGVGGTQIGARDLTVGQQSQISITLNVPTLDPSSVNWDRVMAEAADALGRHIGRGGSLGPIRISHDRI